MTAVNDWVAALSSQAEAQSSLPQFRLPWLLLPVVNGALKRCNRELRAQTIPAFQSARWSAEPGGLVLARTCRPGTCQPGSAGLGPARLGPAGLGPAGLGPARLTNPLPTAPKLRVLPTNGHTVASSGTR